LAEHLDRDALIEIEVRAFGNDTHTAVPKDRLDAILALEYLANADASVGWFNTLRHAAKS
jgi:hypothetical protein